MSATQSWDGTSGMTLTGQRARVRESFVHIALLTYAIWFIPQIGKTSVAHDAAQVDGAR